MAVERAISPFQRRLTLWTLACMAIGVAIGKGFPSVPAALARMDIAGVSIPIAILIWAMITPMMATVDFQGIKNVAKNPKGLFVTWIVNWIIKPFTMYALAYAFIIVLFKRFIPSETGAQYLAGAVLLGAAPCTAMVFVWSALAKGNASYTVAQVATNDLIILVAFVPIVKTLLGASQVEAPYSLLFASVVLFVAIPLLIGVVVRRAVVGKRGKEYFERVFLRKFDGITTCGLLLTLVLIFSAQADALVDSPGNIAIIAIPLTVQTFIIFFLTYGVCRALKLPDDVTAPASMIGASNFFELAVAVATALFGASSPATLATTVGVLTEVPVMLTLVRIANRLRASRERKSAA